MVGNGDDKQHIEYVEIVKTTKKKVREDIRKYHQDIIRQMVVTPKSLKKVRRTQRLGQVRLITLLDNQSTG